MGISLKNFSIKAEEALIAAQQHAKQLAHSKIEPEHLLYALLIQEDGLVEPYLRKVGANPTAIREDINQLLLELPKQTEPVEQAYISRNLHAVILQAEQESLLLSEEFVNPQHLLLGIVRHKAGKAQEVLLNYNVTSDSLLQQFAKVTQREQETSSDFSARNPLEAYCTDILQLARENHLDPVIGRDEEVRRLIQILCRRMKNNPVLIGEPGVGKTAIVEGLAYRILHGDVPDSLKEKRLLSLDLGALIAGATYRGEFESRLKSLLKAVEAASGEIILFIDEMHMLMGAGKSESNVDAANLLKPALARGVLHCIGATTINEFKKYVEKDAALVRRFQQILVEEPDWDSTVAILRGLKPRYELHHAVKIKDAALLAAVSLAQRYVTERYLPDKAIDLVDEAASTLRIQMDSLPTEVDQLDRKIMHLEIEHTALQKENDPATRNRLKELQHEILGLKERSQHLKQIWEEERAQLKRVHTLKESIEHTKTQEMEAQRQGNFELAARLHYETLDDLEKQLKTANLRLDLNGNSRLLKEEVDEEDIAIVVSQWTGVPVAKMLEEEKRKLAHMEHRLGERVIGQKEALASVSNAIRRARAGIQDPNRPIGSFIFLGGSGVGKTELARVLAEFLFDDEKSLIRFDMSEYMEKHSATRLIGAPPGYVGFEEGGALTEAIRRRPYAVLLFDEIEKAHADVFNLFLQILDEGHLTDSQGRRVDFKNTTIIMTTNLAHQAILNAEETGSFEEVPSKIEKELLQNFRPEFLNRVDEVIIFKSLTLPHLRQICLLQIQTLQQRLNEQNIHFTLTDTAYMYLAKKSHDPAFGARPLKRTIQREIQDVLASKILDGSLPAGSKIAVDIEQGHLVFHH